MSQIDSLLRRAQAPVDEPKPGQAAATRGDGDVDNAPLADEKTAKAPLPKADKYIVALYLTLCVLSVVELYSASSREVTSGNVFGPIIRHCAMLAMGIALCFGVSRVKIKFFKPFALGFTVVSVVLMVYVLVAGDVINGARRSFTVAGIQIQPAEFLKLSSVLIIAYVMSRNQIKGGVRNRALVISALIVVMFGGLLFSQGLTNTALMMGISLSMILLSGVSFKKFLILIIAYGVVAFAGIKLKMSGSDGDSQAVEQIVNTGRDASGKAATINRGSTWNGRMSRFFNDSVPKYEQPITSHNRQEMYSYMAQANGGIFGVFPGNSRETARLPLAFSDYIYSIIVEDLGFIGGIFVLLIYLSLIARAGTIAARCDRAFPALLVMGLAFMIALQALFHMAIVTGVFPVSGQPLPMFSKGGTSILITSLAFGIMLSVSRYATTAGRRKAKRAATDLPDDMAAVNPAQLKS